MSKIKHIFQWGKAHKKTSIAIIIALLFVLFLFRPKPPKQIDTVTVKSADIVSSISGNGTVQAGKEADLSFLSGGKIASVNVKKGDSVKAGQVIATLDERSAEDNLQTALRNYSEQRNTFDATKDTNQNRTPEQALNDQMKRVLENNQYDLDKAVLSVELQDLAKQNAVLTTPISGIVTRADITTAGVSATPATVYSVVDPSSLVFSIDVDEADIGKVTQDEKVKVNLDAYPDQTTTLPVSRIDFASHTTSTGGTAYTVEVSLDNTNVNQYRVGMTGTADIITDERHQVLVIPSFAVTDNGTVFVKTKTGYQEQKVALGIQNDTDAEVISGLHEGDIIAAQASDIKVVKGKPQIQ